MSNIRVRFAPSPTGMLHLGGLRTALYDYIFAKKQGGKFILRIEDTDRNRYVEGAVENLVNSLQMMGIDFDEGPGKDGGFGPYFQSERLDIYHKYIEELLENGFAYKCFCTKEEIEKMREKAIAKKENPKYDGTCRNLTPEEVQAKIDAGMPYVVRLKIPENRMFTFYDKIRGKVEIDSSLIDDQILLKTDGYPTYHLAAVVDDHLMEISHVIRGEEWLSSTPKHIYLYEVFGWKAPTWVHLPLILNTDKSKLSKRHGDFSVEGFMGKGYLKEALVNFIALLGWHPSSDEEIFNLGKMIEKFSFKRVNKAGAIFDNTKLDWMNSWYLRNLDMEYIAEVSEPFFIKVVKDISDKDKYRNIIKIGRDYAQTLVELAEWAKPFYFDLEFTKEDKEILNNENSQAVFKHYLERFSEKDVWTLDELKDLVKKSPKELNIKGKNYYFPLRLVFFGKTSGPGVGEIIEILGIEESKKRLQKALI